MSQSILNLDNWIPVSKEQAVTNDLLPAEDIHSLCLEIFMHSTEEENEDCKQWQCIQKLSTGFYWIQVAGRALKTKVFEEAVKFIFWLPADQKVN
jgi:hypothetical protein